MRPGPTPQVEIDGKIKTQILAEQRTLSKVCWRHKTYLSQRTAVSGVG
jgi:hypothetical protein